MARPTKSDDSSTAPRSISDKKKGSDNSFTADMHFIVTRNKRNVWQDDHYDTPPTTADLPVFN